ncbi:MAG: FecR domain-containing protein [bacterium]
MVSRMKPVAIISATLILLLAFVATSFAQNIPVGKVKFIIGLLEVDKGSGWTKAKINEQLFVGYKLRTSSNSKATIELTDKSVIRLNANTEYELTSARTHKVGVGEIFATITQGSKYTANSNTAVATVRGTAFLFRADGFLAVKEGEVDFAAVANIEAVKTVTSSMAIKVQADGTLSPPETVNVDALIDWTKDLAGGVQVNVTIKVVQDQEEAVDALKEHIEKGGKVGTLRANVDFDPKVK